MLLGLRTPADILRLPVIVEVDRVHRLDAYRTTKEKTFFGFVCRPVAEPRPSRYTYMLDLAAVTSVMCQRTFGARGKRRYSPRLSVWGGVSFRNTALRAIRGRRVPVFMHDRSETRIRSFGFDGSNNL